MSRLNVNPHPGHVLLRALVPDTFARRKLVIDLCKGASPAIRRESVALTSIAHSGRNPSTAEISQVLAFIDSI